MKKLILIIFLLIIPTICFALGPAMVGMLGGGSGAASVGTETIGTTSIGGSTWAAAEDRLVSSTVTTISNAGTVSKIYAYISCDTATDDIEFGIYKGATLSTAILIGKKAFSDIGVFAAQWKEFDVSDQSWLVTAGSYWLVAHTSASNDILFYYDTGGAGTAHYSGVVYGNNWPDPAGNWSDSDRDISIKADIAY